MFKNIFFIEKSAKKFEHFYNIFLLQDVPVFVSEIRHQNQFESITTIELNNSE